MMESERLTFVIPFYQNLNYLALAIQSVREQTCDGWKAIVLDDRGAHDAEELVASFKDSRFLYVRNETNLGLAENWNKGLALAKTEFITIFHADDMLMPNYLQEVLLLMDRHPEATAGHCRSEIVDENGERCFSFINMVKKFIRPKSWSDVVTVGEPGVSSLLSGSWIICPTLCYRKNQIDHYAFDAKWRFMVDVELFCRVLMAGGSIVGSRVTAYRYRRHVENQTAKLTKSAHRFVEEIAFLGEINSKALELKWSKCAKKSKRKTLLRAHLLLQSILYLIDKKCDLFKRAFLSALSGRDQFV